MPSETADNAHKAPRPQAPVPTTDRRFQEAIERFRQAGKELTAARDGLLRLLDATEVVNQATDKESAP